MKIYRLKPLSVCETNSYIVASEENNCVLIDAPADPDYILGEIESHGLTLKKIFLTHGHFDHVGAVNKLRERYPQLTVCLHEKDLPMVTGDPQAMTPSLRMTWALMRSTMMRACSATCSRHSAPYRSCEPTQNQNVYCLPKIIIHPPVLEIIHNAAPRPQGAAMLIYYTTARV